MIPFLTLSEPFLTLSGAIQGHFGVILDHFWVNPGSFWGHLGIILASFGHHFGVVSVSFLPHFDAFLCPFWAIFWPFLTFWAVFWAFLGLKLVILGGFGSKKMDWNPKPLFWRGHLELSIREQIRSNEHEWLEIWPVLDAKKAILHRDRKLCFARISFKSTLYKNRSVCERYVLGGTVSGFRVPLDTIEHAYLFLDHFWPL